MSSEQEKLNTIPPEFYDILKSLEVERKEAYAKTKGIFGRAFWKVSLGLSLFFLPLYLLLPIFGELTLDAKITSAIMNSCILGLIGAGIYSWVKKRENAKNITHLIKNKLVSKLVDFVNPELSYSEKGISFDEFEKSDLVRSRGLLQFNSDDKIEGTINGQKISIAECRYDGNHFNGLFIQLDIGKLDLKHAIKVYSNEDVKLAKSFVLKNTSGILRIYIQDYNSKKFQADSNLELFDDPIYENSKYQIYSFEKENSLPLLTPDFHKIVDFILAKYDYKDAYISLFEDKFCLAVNWDKNLFETDFFIKENLVESGLVETYYKDLVKINEILKEVSVFGFLK